MVTIDQLKLCYPRMARNPKLCALLYPLLVSAMVEAHINTPQRIAAFLSQVGLESAELKYMAEVWGPTPQQLRYDTAPNLIKRLGNHTPGDGYRYRGAGPLQVTGRAAFRAAGQALGLDLEGHPELAFTPEVGFRMAAWFWNTRSLNSIADRLTMDPALDISPIPSDKLKVADCKPFDTITLRINGGFIARDLRNAYYTRICKILKP